MALHGMSAARDALAEALAAAADPPAAAVPAAALTEGGWEEDAEDQGWRATAAAAKRRDFEASRSHIPGGAWGGQLAGRDRVATGRDVALPVNAGRDGGVWYSAASEDTRGSAYVVNQVRDQPGGTCDDSGHG